MLVKGLKVNRMYISLDNPHSSEGCLYVVLPAALLISPGAKIGTWKCLRVQCFMIDPESIGVLKEIKLGCHDGNLGELFLFA